MAWTTPRTWVAGEVVTASLMNTHVRDNLDALRAGGIAVASQAAQDFIYASSATQFARVAAVSGRIPRYSGSAWGMILPIATWLVTNATETTTTSGTYASTSLSTTYTPQTTSSTLLFVVTQVVSGDNGDGQSVRIYNTTQGVEIAIIYQKIYGPSDYGTPWYVAGLGAQAPASTSTLTIRTEQLRYSGSGSGVTSQPSSLTSRMLIMEIGA